MKQKPLSMTLSNIPIEEKRTTVSDSAIIKQLKDQIKQNNNSVAEYVQSMINSGSTNSYVLYRQNEILAMDNKDINSAINVVRLNKHGLAFSQTGYYGEYTYGFTIDGVLNANLIRTGILTAILIQSVSGDCSINLETGEVNFNKGSIKGPGIDISLDNGYVRTFATIAGEIFEVMLSQGGIKSNHSLSVKAQEKMNLESSGNWLYLLCQEGANSTKWSNILMSKDNVIISADGGGSGKVLINGKNGVEINGREITSTLNNIETVMLRSEGII